MIGKVGQTSRNFFDPQQPKDINQKSSQSITSKTDEFIRSSVKRDLWNYSMQEIKSPLRRSYSAFGSIPEPDWNRIPTKGGRTLSYEIIHDRMKTLAQQQAYAETNNVSKEEWNAIIQSRNELCIQYISDFSPDRKLLYKLAEKEVPKDEKDELKYPLFFTLVDILCDLDDIALNEYRKDSKKQKNTGNQGMVRKVYQTGGGYEYEICVGDQCFMRTSNGIWTYEETPLETMKREEFNKLYNKALKEAKKMLEIEGLLDEV